MSKEIELERTYLAAYLPKELKNTDSTYLEDTYIPEDDTFAVLRLRQKGEKYEITKNVPLKKDDYSQHSEHTITLKENEYRALYVSSKKRVTKNRYKVKIDGHFAEVDVFDRDLYGLVLIDFEFPDIDSLNNFDAPDCCLKDVTQCREILGGQLAGKKYSDVEPWLKEQEYRKLT